MERVLENEGDEGDKSLGICPHMRKQCSHIQEVGHEVCMKDYQ